MAPKARQHKKKGGKNKPGKANAPQGPAPLGEGLVLAKHMDRLRAAIAGPDNVHGETRIRPAGVECGATASGWCSPAVSDFFAAGLTVYGLQVAHLHPDAIIVMAIFAHLCENFVSLAPCVAFFRHFFVPEVSDRNAPLGSVFWTLRDGEDRKFPAGPLRTASSDSWPRRWCLADVGEDTVDVFNPPDNPPFSDLGAMSGFWEGLDARDGDFLDAAYHVRRLVERGLTTPMVVRDFLQRWLAPLQRRSHPAWAYSGVDDPTRLFPGEEHELDNERLAQ
ncbi:uncharacterized protein LOC104581795 [Brachypodium distachyon]|uniref:uncharacterized protein LOC104581795 n=1 Tax=Brachypodium distachyon TaxID=15368 RepID=UPI000D0D5B4B|nr:uncharacterized protein LOC104581795 [Brachypodium distachyon]|eukprot:XP_024313367.1 uncharacterized protein LOC104581795 [Brachypodium distachyon]